MIARPATEGDLAAIGRIDEASHGSARWIPHEYLAFDCVVAEVDGEVAGYLVSRAIAKEREILNLAVHPRFRRRGIAAALLSEELKRDAAAFFLEVREGNAAATQLYENAGFEHVGRRSRYYQNPPEGAIVMRKLS